MSKKIFILFLSIFVILFAVSGAMAAGFSYALWSSGDVTEPEFYTDDPEEGIEGYNFTSRLRLPTLKLNQYYNLEDDPDEDSGTAIASSAYAVKWSVVPINFTGTWLNIESFTSDNSGDIAVISGVLPDSADEYNFCLVAEVISYDSTVSEIYSDPTGTKTSFDAELSVTVNAFDTTSYTLETSGDYFNACVTPADGVTLGKASTAYSVTVSGRVLSNVYTSHIVSGDEDNPISLPNWLTYTVNETDTVDGETVIKSLTITFKNGATVLPDAKGVVRIPLTSDSLEEDNTDITTTRVLGWDVTYQAAKEEDRPFGVSGDKEVSFDFPVNRTTSTQTKTITYYGGSNAESVTSCDISGTGASLISADWTKLSGDTGSIDITVTIPETTSSVSTAVVKSDTYEGSLVFFGENGSSFDISVEIKIDTEASLSLTASTQRFSLQAGASRKVTITADSAVTDWEVAASDDISFDVTASDDTTTVVTINPLEDAEAGTYSVIVNATGENGAAGSVTLTVTVTEAATTTLTIAADVTELELEAGESDVVIVTAEEGTVASWSVDADDGITCEITASDDLEAEINVTADEDAEEGSYIVTITATDEDGNTATEEVTVTVTSSGEAAYSVSLTASNTAVTLPAGGSRDITITAGGTHSGDLTWKNSDAPMGLVVSIVNSSNSSATARIGVYATATAGTKTPITITATDAAGNSGSISITVTVTTSGSSDGSRQQVQTQDAVLPTAISDAGKTVLQSVYSGIVFLQDTPNVFGTTGIALDSAKNYIASDREAILSLKTITLSTDQAVVAIGTFPYDDVLATGQISAGENIYLELIPSGDIANAGIVTVSATKQGEIVSTSDGSAVSTMPSSNATPLAMIARDLKANTTYSPVITKLSSSGGTTTSGDFVLGPANVGCNGGFGSLFGVLAMAFTASALYFRRQRV